MAATPERFVFAARLADLKASGCLVRQVGGQTLALFQHNDTIYAVDNRCPHMGFPLDRGTVRDGILTCHWHHARFDLASGGTFDLWADDARSTRSRCAAARFTWTWAGGRSRGPTCASACATAWSANCRGSSPRA